MFISRLIKRKTGKSNSREFCNSDKLTETRFLNCWNHNISHTPNDKGNRLRQIKKLAQLKEIELEFSKEAPKFRIRIAFKFLLLICKPFRYFQSNDFQTK